MFQHPGSNEVRENLRVDGREGSATAATPCCRGSVGLRGAAAGRAFHSPSAPPCANHPVMRLRLDRLEAVVDGVTAATPITGAGVHTAGPLVVDIGLGTSGVRWGFGSEAAGPVRVRSVTSGLRGRRRPRTAPPAPPWLAVVERVGGRHLRRRHRSCARRRYSVATRPVPRRSRGPDVAGCPAVGVGRRCSPMRRAMARRC